MQYVAAFMILALVVVMLVVPWLMTRRSAPNHTQRRAVEIRSATLFGSPLERRLWLWTLAVIVAIYASLGPAPEWAAALRERNLLRVSSTAVLLLLVSWIAGRWVKTSPGAREIGAGVGVMTVYAMALIRIPHPEERTHLFEYGLVAILIHQALVERRRSGRRVPAPAALALAATALLGWLDEGVQSLLPTRVYDLRDVGFNALAGLMAISSSLILARARRRDAPGA